MHGMQHHKSQGERQLLTHGGSPDWLLFESKGWVVTQAKGGTGSTWCSTRRMHLRKGIHTMPRLEPAIPGR